MINFKQKELINIFLEKVIKEYPNIEFQRIQFSPEDPSDLWIWVYSPYYEIEELEINRFAAEISIELLLKYGYSITMLCDNQKSEKETNSTLMFGLNDITV